MPPWLLLLYLVLGSMAAGTLLTLYLTKRRFKVGMAVERLYLSRHIDFERALPEVESLYSTDPSMGGIAGVSLLLYLAQLPRHYKELFRLINRHGSPLEEVVIREWNHTWERERLGQSGSIAERLEFCELSHPHNPFLIKELDDLLKLPRLSYKELLQIGTLAENGTIRYKAFVRAAELAQEPHEIWELINLHEQCFAAPYDTRHLEEQLLLRLVELEDTPSELLEIIRDKGAYSNVGRAARDRINKLDPEFAHIVPE